MPPRIRVALLSTGSEILQGLYPDTNAQWMAQRLDSLGFDVVAIQAVRDDLEATVTAIRALSEVADLIISSGGLGPTEDDRLREVASSLWKASLEEHAGLLRAIRARFRRLKRAMPETNRRQAFIPQGADPLPNAWGTAPGFALKRTRRLAAFIALPGPPVELRPMFEKRALPWLRRNLWPEISKARTVIHTLGWSESRVNEVITDLFTTDPALDVTILARSGKIDVRLTASGASARSVKTLLMKTRREVLRRLPAEIVYGFDDETLEEIVNRLLLARGWKVALAESCTGGLVTERLTRVPGASAVIDRGVITYANEAKIQVLGVRPATLRKHGAVSEECVREMAKGVRRWAKADLGLAVTGIAGPSGGTAEKPVGTVWIAAATKSRTRAELCFITRRDRESIRLWSADRLLNLARRILA